MFYTNANSSNDAARVYLMLSAKISLAKRWVRAYTMLADREQIELHEILVDVQRNLRLNKCDIVSSCEITIDALNDIYTCIKYDQCPYDSYRVRAVGVKVAKLIKQLSNSVQIILDAYAEVDHDSIDTITHGHVIIDTFDQLYHID